MLQTTTSRIDYTTNGITVSFAVPFYFLEATHLKVILTNLSTGAVTYPVLNAEYLVSGAGVESGGTVTFIAAPASAHRLSILRAAPYTQLKHYVEGDPFPAASHEQALDQLTMECQQLSEAKDRALTLPENSSGVSAELPSPVANQIIAWNQDATALQNLDPAGMATVVAFGTAKADIFTGDGATTEFTLSANPGAQANLDVSVGGVTQYPGIDYIWSGGTKVIFASAPPAGVKVLLRYFQGLPQGTADAGATTFQAAGTSVTRTAQSKLRDHISAADYGAIGDGVADDTAALQAAIDAAAGRTLEIGAGVFKLSSALAVASAIVIQGCGAELLQVTADQGILALTAVDGAEISGITFRGCAGSQSGSAGYGQIKLTNCSNISIHHNTFTETSYCGIFGGGSPSTSFNTNVTISDNLFTGYVGSVRGACAVCAYSSSRAWKVTNNRVVDTGSSSSNMDWGFAFFESSGSGSCYGHLVEGNTITNVKDHAIVFYSSTYSERNEGHVVSNNNIDTVRTTPLNSGGGNGVYLLGVARTNVSGNHISNTNIGTAAGASIVSAGIAVNYAYGSINITGNDLYNCRVGGIVLSNNGPNGSATGKALLLVDGNTIYNNVINATADASAVGIGLFNTNYGVTISNNSLYEDGVSHVTCSVYITNSPTDVVLSGNNFRLYSYSSGNIIPIDGVTRLTMHGNSIIDTRSGSNNTLVSIASCTLASVVGNVFDAGLASGKALSIASTTNSRFSGNVLRSGGTTALQTSGACTASFVDESNVVTAGNVVNQGTGITVARLGTAAPGTGSAQQGDRVINTSPSAAGAAEWRCTSSGSPGTWTTFTLN